jgi:sulfur-carrier protein
MDTITKTVKLSATLRQFADAKEIDVALPPDATVRDLFVTLTSDYPALVEYVLESSDTLKPSMQLLVDGRHIDFLQGFDTPLAQAQTIFLIPPIMGG